MLKKLTRNQKIMAIGGLVALAAVVLFVYKSQHSSSKAAVINPSSGSTGQSSQAASVNNTSKNSSTSTSSTPKQTSSSTSSGSSLTTRGPILNHGTVSLSNNDGTTANSTKMVSICNTSPGAQCYIQLTSSDGTTKQTAAKTVGSSGSVEIDWDASQSPTNLSVGTWQARAVATLSGQTSYSDSETLVVSS